MDFQSKNDYSMFTKGKGEEITILIVYVEDILNRGNVCINILLIKQFLANNFSIKDLGGTELFFGNRISLLSP